ncbi:hypothetical protein [Arthrobacter castelli]|uniref:hypothetical protein n=1 Tax=Arthrobacter castelli TaxID=271431 RepID=UPI0004112A9F|nr:hypothetical protein [Arthrobacter castelli]
MDTDIIPLDELAQRDILSHVCALGDAAETSYLEVKSTLDLTSTKDKAKIAKFLLGAANRLPRQAKMYFRGYAVLVIGAQKGHPEGVARGTEAHELAEKLRPYLGPHFPAFEFGRIVLNDTREVLFVIAPPPEAGQPIFPCHKNFQDDSKKDTKDNLFDGAIYVRGPSNTLQARSRQVIDLVERARSSGRPPITLNIELLGSVNRVVDINEKMERLYNLEEENCIKKAENFTKPAGPNADHWMERTEAILPRGISDRIEADEIKRQEKHKDSLKKWKREKPENIEKGREHLLGAAFAGAGIRVTSHNRSITKPRLIITFYDCEAFTYYTPEDADYGKVVKPIIRPRQQPPYVPGFEPGTLIPRDYPVSWNNSENNVEVTLTPESFRPNTPWESGQDDYVLVTRDSQAETVAATWVLTEEGYDETTKGDLQITPGRITKAHELVIATFFTKDD